MALSAAATTYALETVGDSGQVMADRDRLKITFDSGGTALPTGTA
jgi:hypothetical protein